jgi:uncharacterized radical SAM protein YgiQ
MPEFMPTTADECQRLGWSELDVVLVTGDVYLDAPHIGVAVIGRVLLNAGYRVGIIAQPDVHTDRDIARLGEPRLFWGVSGGSVDSMIANYTAAGRRRRSDDMTPGGVNDRRPDRAVLAYSHLIRRHFKQTRPIVLGGIEASLRRISHYDAWSDAVRRSILFDAKADLLLYGMADQSVAALADKLARGEDVHDLRGLCYISRELPTPDPGFDAGDVQLPSHEEVSQDKAAFARMFALFYANADPLNAHRLVQQQDTRYLVHNPPALAPSPAALDAVYELPYARAVHPYYRKQGPVAAMQTIPFSLTTHRGCFGECRFCAIAVHQGRRVVSRSHASIVREAEALARHPDFKGIIADVGGPTANMYAMTCGRRSERACADKSCLFPTPCKRLSVDHGPQIRLLQALRAIPGVRKVFVASGLRYDLILADATSGRRYLEELLRHHTSGQLKIAPEHIDDPLLRLMGKPGRDQLEAFLALFEEIDRRMPRRQFLTYYFMAAHPGCTIEQMHALRSYAERRLHLVPEQVQIFTPSPSTFATLMYWTGIDPFSGAPLFVERGLRAKIAQKEILTAKQPKQRPKIGKKRREP